MKRCIEIVLLTIAVSACTNSQTQMTKYGVTGKDLAMLIGAWDSTETYEHYEIYNYSWGKGNIIPNSTIEFDYSKDNENKLTIYNPGLGQYTVLSVEKTNPDQYKIMLENAFGPNKGQKGFLLVTFTREGEIFLDDRNFYNYFGGNEPKKLYKIAGPDILQKK